jgi:hypothetical protein
MDVDLTLESEKFTGTEIIRAFFLTGGKESHIHTETLTMNRQTDPRFKCTDVQAYIIVSNVFLAVIVLRCIRRDIGNMNQLDT